jgi:type IV pilus assembly protein PilO
MNPQLEKALKLPLYQRLIIVFAIVGAIAAAFFYLLYLPESENLQRLVAQNQTLETKLAEDRRIASNLPKFKEEYEKMKEQLDQALTELPNEREIPGLLSSIASLAKDNGLDVLRFKPGQERPSGFYAEVPIELKLTGSFHQLASFSQAVGDLPRIVNLNNLSMGAPKVVEGKAQLSIDCLAVTYRFIEEPKAVQGPPGKKGTKK